MPLLFFAILSPLYLISHLIFRNFDIEFVISNPEYSRGQTLCLTLLLDINPHNTISIVLRFLRVKCGFFDGNLNFKVVKPSVSRILKCKLQLLSMMNKFLQIAINLLNKRKRQICIWWLPEAILKNANVCPCWRIIRYVINFTVVVPKEHF